MEHLQTCRGVQAAGEDQWKCSCFLLPNANITLFPVGASAYCFPAVIENSKLDIAIYTHKKEIGEGEQ